MALRSSPHIRVCITNFSQGVFDGVTGIVRKPVEGARQEGVSGFFKGGSVHKISWFDFWQQKHFNDLVNKASVPASFSIPSCTHVLLVRHALNIHS